MLPGLFHEGEHGFREEVFGSSKSHLPDQAFRAQERPEPRSFEAVSVGTENPSEIVVIPGAGTNPTPVLKSPCMLEDGPKFLRNDLFQGIDQYLRFQWFVVAVEHRPAGVRLEQCFIYRDPTMTRVWGRRCQGNCARISKAS